MTAALEQHTVLPPEKGTRDLADLAALLVGLSPSGQAKLVSPDGAEIALPPPVYGALREVVEALSQGLAITIAPHNTLLTTQEAADLLGISRPTLVRLLVDGEIPYELRGRHRRVALADVVAYQNTARTRRRVTLDEMTNAASEDGLYDDPDGFVQTR